LSRARRKEEWEISVQRVQFQFGLMRKFWRWMVVMAAHNVNVFNSKTVKMVKFYAVYDLSYKILED
jgi:hypothetical protein